MDGLQSISTPAVLTKAMASLAQDLRYGVRVLLKSPVFTAIAVLTLGLGIGATTAIFSVVNSILLRPLPYQDAGRLVSLSETKLPQFPQFSIAPGNFLDWRKQQIVNHLHGLHDGRMREHQ